MRNQNHQTFMKRLLLLALCALFSANAGARTLYVDASRPNNNGNGLSRAKAKKTIQAAINVAQAGDTILVYPGKYAPIKTNNRKIVVKSVCGKGSTTVVRPKTKTVVATTPCYVALAEMGKAYKLSYVATSGPDKGKRKTCTAFRGGTASTIAGFTLNGRNWDAVTTGVHAGVLKSCRIVNLGDGSPSSRYNTITAAWDAKLVRCIVENNYVYSLGAFLSCRLNRCIVRGNQGIDWTASFAYNTTFSNTLIASNEFYDSYMVGGCSFWNCTIADNVLSLNSTSSDNRYVNCILRNNCDVCWDRGGWSTEIVPIDRYTTGTFTATYKKNKNPRFVDAGSGNYRLRKESPCIGMGKVSDTIRKKIGAKDLAGRKRIRGGAVDMGCYEY